MPGSHASRTPRYEVRTEEGSASGGLFQYEQKTFFHVVDLLSNETVMTFESETTASLSRSGAGWTDHVHTGVSAVVVEPDEKSVRVTHHGGWQESVPLP
jgi:hypothetical protein